MDISEKNNLAKKYPKVLEELKALRDAYVAEVGEPAGMTPPAAATSNSGSGAKKGPANKSKGKK